MGCCSRSTGHFRSRSTAAGSKSLAITKPRPNPTTSLGLCGAVVRAWRMTRHPASPKLQSGQTMARHTTHTGHMEVRGDTRELKRGVGERGRVFVEEPDRAESGDVDWIVPWMYTVCSTGARWKRSAIDLAPSAPQILLPTSTNSVRVTCGARGDMTQHKGMTCSSYHALLSCHAP